MALINCPECGGEVSSNADTCVHCGCNFTYCPECGAVHLGKVQTCSACGYRIEAEVRAESGGETAEDFISACKRRSATDKKVNLALKISTSLCVLLMAILLAVAFVKVLTWNAGSFDDVLRAKDLIDKSHGLVIAALTFLMLAIVSVNAREFYFHVLYAKWMGKFKIDVVKYLSRDDMRINASFLSKDEFFGDVGAVAYLTVVPNAANLKIFKLAGQFLAVLGGSIALGYFCFKTFDGIINSELYNRPFEFGYVPLIIAAVFVVARIMVTNICDKLFNNRKNEWLKSVNLL